MNTAQLEFLKSAADQAARAGHPFPRMAAAEAALESNYGNSELARDACNLFGMKQHAHPIYGTLTLPTREWENGPDGHAIDGRWTTVGAKWVSYPTWAACFADRKATLGRLANAYPHYAAALRAQDPQTYITEVSRSWSTDPERGAKCLSIFQDFEAAAPAEVQS